MAKEYLSLDDLIRQYGGISDEDIQKAIDSNRTLKPYLRSDDYLRQKDRKLQRKQRQNNQS